MLLDKKIPLRYLLRKTRAEILFVSILTVAISITDELFRINEIGIPLAIPSILGTAISLILAFRTGQSYGRWWEARMIWGAIVNDSRTLLRQLLSFVQSDAEETNTATLMIRKVAYRQIAWCYALGRSLRKQTPLKGLDTLLEAADITAAKMHDNIPNALLQMHATDLKFIFQSGWINSYQQIQIDETLQRLCDSMGKSERIKNTVFPATYSLIVHLFLYLFILVLPFGLVDELGFIQIPLVISVGMAFFLIEKTAIYMQDPFENLPTDTPITSIARTIEINLRQMLDETQVPEKAQPKEGYYVL
jgi:ion channel-forming bestrophin family protein